MRLRATSAALAALLSAVPAAAQETGAFDYFLLALSWNPSWCETTGDARDAEECGAGAELGFTLHGLWPQYEDGWPEWCETEARDPTPAETDAMADLMASGELAWYQWKKHGRCSGMQPEAYFELARDAVGFVEVPPDAGGRQITAPALEDAFLALNPEIGPEGLVVTCRDDLVMEVRICLEPDLDPRDCAPDVLERACRGGRELELPPKR